MMAGKLSLLSDSSDSEVDFKVNKSYADRYDKWRHKEELQKLKDIGEDDSESSSSESEEIPEIEEDFLKTLSLLKSKDPKIYDQNVTFFKDTGTKQSETKKDKKPKPLFMKDYERKLILENKGIESDDEYIPYEGPTYSEEQEKLKESFKAALIDSSDGEEKEDGLLQVRQKTKAEKESEEAEYMLWLKGQKATVSDEKDMSFLQKFWNDPKIDEDEKFLKDYILNKKYVDEDKSGEIPTYDEITENIGSLSDDEKVIEQQEIFEHKYNFRFEEPDTEFIKRYPRTIGDSLRRTDNKRKMKRDDYAERKRKEKEQRREELKRLKALKRKEIEERFEKLKEVSGYENLDMGEIDMESDFDPEKHDQKMKELFNEDYYEVEEEQKPEFPYDEELDDENWDKWTGDTKSKNFDEKHESQKSHTDEDISENEEREKDPKLEFQKEMIESSQTGKKRTKKKSLFAKLIAKQKPVFDPDGKSFEEYLDEYYQLDYEDVIGDMPVRFRYRKVVPNSFGLTTDEILKADDKELNRWCSVKKTMQYRNTEEEIYDVQAFVKKAQNLNAKKKFLQSLFAEPEQDEAAQSETILHLKDNKDDTPISESKKIKKSKNTKQEYFLENSTAETCDSEIYESQNIASKPSTSFQNADDRNSKKLKKGNKRKHVNQESNYGNNSETGLNNHDNIIHNVSSVSGGSIGKSSKKKKDVYSAENNQDVTDHNLLTKYSTSENMVIETENSSKTVEKARKRKHHNVENKGEADNCNQVELSIDNVDISKKVKKLKKKKKIQSKESQEDSDNLNTKWSENSLTSKPSPIMSNSLPDKQKSGHESIDSSFKLPDKLTDNNEVLSSSKKRKKKKKKKKLKDGAANMKNPQNISHQKHKNKSFKTSDKKDTLDISDARLKAYGINPKKFKRTLNKTGKL